MFEASEYNLVSFDVLRNGAYFCHTIRRQRSIYLSGGANGGPRNAHIDPVHARFTKPWEGEGLPFGDYRGKGGMKGSCGWICIDVEKGSAPSQEKRKTIRHLT